MGKLRFHIGVGRGPHAVQTQGLHTVYRWYTDRVTWDGVVIPDFTWNGTDPVNTDALGSRFSHVSVWESTNRGVEHQIHGWSLVVHDDVNIGKFSVHDNDGPISQRENFETSGDMQIQQTGQTIITDVGAPYTLVVLGTNNVGNPADRLLLTERDIVTEEEVEAFLLARRAIAPNAEFYIEITLPDQFRILFEATQDPQVVPDG